ncbi:oxidoreductase [Pediococcus argentinicus]|uniref:Oxidoreductase n=1 Tax=Pediococcus argentinicus TaxID=480391 RepID=A0A0R2NHK0_9LACO|nr:oxidoreductase [Pediococcus argentinicus]NKZ22032.1 hypothetical protein [Pediococcus argentinicus]GEP19370.1 hypothetical protein LSA03_07540 [Pediococcus argentinicus]
MKAAHQAHVQRVVMTSAFGASGMGYKKDKNDYIFTEKDWSYMGAGSTMDAYYKSKTLAEKAAWDYVKNEAPDMELATILPVAVFGPILGGKASGSNSLLLMLLTGGLPGLMDMYLPVVDVRDLARAHVLALTTPEAAGQRFIISDEMSYSMKDVSNILKQGYPEDAKKVPSMVIPNFLLKMIAPFNHTIRDTAKVLGIDRKMSSKNAHDLLNWEPTIAPKQSVLDAEKSIIDAGLTKKR